VLLLADGILALRNFVESDVTRVHDVPLAESIGAAHVDDEGAFVDEANGIGRRDMRDTLAPEPYFEGEHGRERDEQPRHEEKMIGRKFDQLSHRVHRGKSKTRKYTSRLGLALAVVVAVPLVLGPLQAGGQADRRASAADLEEVRKEIAALE